MTCAEFEVILCDYIDRTLDAEGRQQVETHMQDCASCAQLAGECSVGAGLLAHMPEAAPPPAAVTRILQQIPARQPASVRARGALSGWLGRWFAPVRQPRMVMGMAMTILSFAMLGRFAGIEARQIRAADLSPTKVVAATEDRLHRTWARAVKYYENLRFVYEIQSRLRELTANEEEAEKQNETTEITPGQDSQGGQKR